MISSDLDYNELCAELYFENQFVGIVTQEEGIDNMKIEIQAPKDNKYWHFNFREFKDALIAAEKALLEMRQIS